MTEEKSDYEKRSSTKTSNEIKEERKLNVDEALKETIRKILQDSDSGT